MDASQIVNRASTGLPTTPGAWHRRIWALSWPMILANLAIPLVGAVDTAVMGRLSDARYLGAVAVGATIMSALYWMLGFLRMGVTGLTAQAFGAGNQREMAATVSQAAVAALALGATMVAAQAPLLALALHLFEASAGVETLTADYFGIRIWGAPALLLYMVEIGVLFGLQRMRAALALSLLLNLSNAALDMLLVVGLGWDVKGVAAGTLVSEWVAAIVGLRLATRALADHGCQRPVRADIVQRRRLTELFRLGANLVLRTFFVQLPFFLITALGASLGDVALAANAVLLQFLHITAYGLDGFAHTAETLAGYAFGKRDVRGLRRASACSAAWAGLMAALVSTGYALFGDALIAVFTVLPEVRAAASAHLAWVAVLPLAAVWAFMLDGVFIGATRSAELRNAMILSAAIYLAVLWASFEPLGNHGVWLSMLVFMTARGLILGAMYPGLERRCRTQAQARL